MAVLITIQLFHKRASMILGKEGVWLLQSVHELNFKPPHVVFPSPNDWRDVFVYFLLVDRFDNNQQNLSAYDAGTAPKG